MARNADQLREELQTRLDQLTRRAGKIETDLRRPGESDSEERAIERENDEVLENLDASTLEEVSAIRAALGRLDDGTYGTCSNCNKPIEAQRLAALPHVATCMSCASA